MISDFIYAMAAILLVALYALFPEFSWVKWGILILVLPVIYGALGALFYEAVYKVVFWMDRRKWNQASACSRYHVLKERIKKTDRPLGHDIIFEWAEDLKKQAPEDFYLDVLSSELIPAEYFPYDDDEIKTTYQMGLKSTGDTYVFCGFSWRS